MKKKLQPKEETFRVKFETRDGSLVMNREADRDYYLMHGRPCQDFVDYMLKKDSREKGVEVVSYTLDNSGLNAIVEWL